MKTRLAFLMLLLPALAFTQNQGYSTVMLKTLDAKSVNAAGIFQSSQPTLVYFYNDDQSADVEDILDEIGSLNDNPAIKDKIRIILVYSSAHESYEQIKAILNGNSVEFEAYIDTNGDLQRAMGLLSNSILLLNGNDETMAARYQGDYDFSADISGGILPALVCDNLGAPASVRGAH
jgi:hypothetical protein